MHVDHIGLAVGDLERQRDWYERAFGFAPAHAFEIPGLGLRGQFLVGPDGLALELLERQGSSHPGRPSSPPDALLRQGWAHLCLRVEDVPAAYERALEAGGASVAAPGPSPEPAVEFAFVADPEGNLVELLDRPGPVTA